MDRLSVVLPAYNEELMVGKTCRVVGKILAEAGISYELVVVDDGSTDKTPIILSDFAKDDKRITFFNREHICNLGVVKSFMDLLANIDADLYMFSDQDDVWKKDKIQG